MKRVIKFRGLQLDGKGWAFGHYTEGSPNHHYITNCDGSVWQVDPKTIGQFVDMLDRNGKEVFEDDYCHFTDSTVSKLTCSTAVIYANGGFKTQNLVPISYYGKTNIEVIGNVHEQTIL